MGGCEADIPSSGVSANKQSARQTTECRRREFVRGYQDKQKVPDKEKDRTEMRRGKHGICYIDPSD